MRHASGPLSLIQATAAGGAPVIGATMVSKRRTAEYYPPAVLQLTTQIGGDIVLEVRSTPSDRESLCRRQQLGAAQDTMAS